MPGPPKSSPDVKTQALQAAGALHPHPEAVRDEAFLRHPFFDPRDRVQAKYEMVRRHQIDGRPVTEVAARFGVSRQAFYEAAATFAAQGIPGLVPKRPGPKRAHKCSDAILDYVERWRAGEDVRPGERLPAAVARRFGVTIHARSLDRAVARRKKKTPTPGDDGLAPGLDVSYVCQQYEIVRHEAATRVGFGPRGHGMMLLMTRGMPAWLDAVTTLSPPARAGRGTRSVMEGSPFDLAPPVRSELTRLLASLVLTCAQEGAPA